MLNLKHGHGQMPDRENFGVCDITPSKDGKRIAIVLRQDQLGKLSYLLDAAAPPKGCNRTEFNNSLGLFKRAIRYGQQSCRASLYGAKP